METNKTYLVILLLVVLSACSINDIETPETHRDRFEKYNGGILSLVENKAAIKVENIDWREYATPVRNQGTCGACWAYAVCSALELNANKKFGIELDLSEQELIDNTDGTCSGGFPYHGLRYILNNGLGGIGIDGFKTLYTPTASEIISSLRRGAVPCVVRSINHSMALVGVLNVNRGDSIYTLNDVYEWTEVDRKGVVWIFKNSWGRSFGEDGYVYIKTDVSDFAFSSVVGNVFQGEVPEYCEPHGDDSEFISKVQFDNMVFESGNDGYSVNDFFEFKSGGTYFVSITPKSNVWIDTNQNGVFESSEKLNIKRKTTMPIFTGKTRMRVAIDDVPCGVYGEFEDYNINFK